MAGIVHPTKRNNHTDAHTAEKLLGSKILDTPEQIRLPEYIEDQLYSGGGNLPPYKRAKITSALAKGRLPKDMTREDIINLFTRKEG